jgi:hypothetical protein
MLAAAGAGTGLPAAPAAGSHRKIPHLRPRQTTSTPGGMLL